MINFDLSCIKRVIEKLKVTFQIECGFSVYLLVDLYQPVLQITA